MTTTTRQYLTDEAGNKVAVVLPIEEYEELMEDLDDLAYLANHRDEGEPSRPLEEFVAELKAEGSLPESFDK